jgi:hypothetical protein
MNRHASQPTAVPITPGSNARAKHLPGLPCSTEGASLRDDTRRQSAVLLDRAMVATGTGRAWLAARMGVHPAHLTRMCDPEHEKGLSVERLLALRVLAPKLFAEIVRMLGDLEIGEGQPAKDEASHLRLMSRALGDVARAVSRSDLDRALADLESAARQARRDLWRSE